MRISGFWGMCLTSNCREKPLTSVCLIESLSRLSIRSVTVMIVFVVIAKLLNYDLVNIKFYMSVCHV